MPLLPTWSNRPAGGSMTTMAVGEEGGSGSSAGTTGGSTGRPRYTTMAVGENGGTGIPGTGTGGPTGGGRVTTLAVGEEGGTGGGTGTGTGMPGGATGGAPGGRVVTTYAMGEEAGTGGAPGTGTPVGGGQMTTMAVGEEGGTGTGTPTGGAQQGGEPIYRPYGQKPPGAAPPGGNVQTFTAALQEQGGQASTNVGPGNVQTFTAALQEQGGQPLEQQAQQSGLSPEQQRAQGQQVLAQHPERYGFGGGIAIGPWDQRWNDYNPQGETLYNRIQSGENPRDVLGAGHGAQMIGGKLDQAMSVKSRDALEQYKRFLEREKKAPQWGRDQRTAYQESLYPGRKEQALAGRQQWLDSQQGGNQPQQTQGVDEAGSGVPRQYNVSNTGQQTWTGQPQAAGGAQSASGGNSIYSTTGAPPPPASAATGASGASGGAYGTMGTAGSAGAVGGDSSIPGVGGVDGNQLTVLWPGGSNWGGQNTQQQNVLNFLQGVFGPGGLSPGGVHGGIGKIADGTSESGGSASASTAGMSLGQLLQHQYQKAFDANKERENEIRGLYEGMIGDDLPWLQEQSGRLRDAYGARTQAGMQLLEGYGDQAKKDIGDETTRQRASTDQSMIDRGLYNTTVRDNMQQGISRRHADALGSLYDHLAQTNLQAYSNLSGQQLGADMNLTGNEYAARTDLPNRYADFIERITDMYPDIGKYIDLAIRAGQGLGQNQMPPVFAGVFPQGGGGGGYIPVPGAPGAPGAPGGGGGAGGAGGAGGGGDVAIKDPALGMDGGGTGPVDGNPVYPNGQGGQGQGGTGGTGGGGTGVGQGGAGGSVNIGPIGGGQQGGQQGGIQWPEGIPAWMRALLEQAMGQQGGQGGVQQGGEEEEDEDGPSSEDDPGTASDPENQNSYWDQEFRKPDNIPVTPVTEKINEEGVLDTTSMWSSVPADLRRNIVGMYKQQYGPNAEATPQQYMDFGIKHGWIKKQMAG